MFNGLGSFCSHIISDIQNLVRAHYAFCWQPNTANYIVELLYKNKFLCNNIENISNKRCFYIENI